MVKRCVQTGSRSQEHGHDSPSPAAGWMQKLGPPPSGQPPLLPAAHPPHHSGSSSSWFGPRGQAASRSTPFWAGPSPGLQQAFSTSGSCKGPRSRDSSAGASGGTQFWGAEKSLEGHLGDVTQPGEASSSLERGACEHSRLPGRTLQLGGASGPLVNLPKSGTGAGEGGTSCEAEAPGAPASCRDPALSSDICPHFPLEEAMDPRTPAAPGFRGIAAHDGLQHSHCVSTHCDSDLHVS